jgi:hypothetical protein
VGTSKITFKNIPHNSRTGAPTNDKCHTFFLMEELKYLGEVVPFFRKEFFTCNVLETNAFVVGNPNERREDWPFLAFLQRLVKEAILDR